MPSIHSQEERVHPTKYLSAICTKYGDTGRQSALAEKEGLLSFYKVKIKL